MQPQKSVRISLILYSLCLCVGYRRDDMLKLQPPQIRYQNKFNGRKSFRNRLNMKKYAMSLSTSQQTFLLEGIGKMCRAFWGPDSDQCEEMLRTDAYLRPFKELVVNYAPPDVLRQLRAAVGNFTAADALFYHLEEEYIRLFINARGGIAAPLYESCYVSENAILMGQPAMMMKKRLESEGLSLTSHSNDPPDHLSVELEYLYFLLSKGWSDADPVFIDKAVLYASEILPWINAFRQRIINERQSPFYPLAASLLCDLLRLIEHSRKLKGPKTKAIRFSDPVRGRHGPAGRQNCPRLRPEHGWKKGTL